MKFPAKHPNEKLRQESLESIGILDSLPEKDFDEITRLASLICATPIAYISLIDNERQWFKSKIGLDISETTRDLSICGHTILQNDTLVIEDLSKDDRLSGNPLLNGPTQLKFYAGTPLLSPDGLPIGSVCVMDTVTRSLSNEQIEALRALSNQVTRLLKLKKQVKSLKLSEEKLQIKRTALESIVEGIVIQDASESIIDCNAASAKLLNLSKDPITKKIFLNPDRKVIDETGADLPFEKRPAMMCFKTGMPQTNITVGFYEKSNEIKWLKINAVPLFLNDASEISHVVTTFSDITAQIENQKILLKRKNELRFILDSIPHMIGHWNTDLTNLHANSVYSKYFGKTPDEIKGLHISEVLGPEIYQLNLPYLYKVLGGKTVSFERIITNKQEEKRHTLATYIPNFTDNKVTSFLAIVMDITDLKNLEADRQHLEAQLAESARLSALGEMAAGLAHEINNPLTIIGGKNKILLRKMEENKLDLEGARKDFMVIQSTVERIAKIVKGLRTYSRNAESDNFESAGARSVLEDTLELCKEKFKYNLIDIEIDCANDYQIRCKPAQISQILMNLLNNSYDAISELPEKWIRINIIPSEENISFIVKDSGPGIDPSIVNKMMQPFFTTKEVGKGTGLGLSISSGIAKSHNGSLKYDPNEKNTTFVLTLPRDKTKVMTRAS